MLRSSGVATYKMSTRIVQLAKIIGENAALIEEHLQSKGAPEPSFDVDAPKKVQTSDAAELARMKAIAAASEFTDLLKGPAELLRFDWTENASLRIILKLNLAALVPVASDVPFSGVAKEAGLPERDVRRIMRHAMTRHVFREPRKGYVAHTALSRLLVEDKQQLDITRTCAEVLWPASYSMADAVERYPGSEEASQTGFSVGLTSGNQTMWQKFSEDQEMGRRFGVFIGEGGANESLLNDVQWSGKVVDVGGSQGDVLIDVLKRHPQVTEAVVQDIADVVAAGQKRAPAELKDRLRFQTQYADRVPIQSLVVNSAQ